MIPQHANNQPVVYSQLMQTYTKLATLHNLLVPLLKEGLLIAFSGGVDSGFLLWAALQSLQLLKNEGQAGKVAALLTSGPSVPIWDLEDAKAFASELDVELIIKESHELQQEAYVKNDALRCYFCKSELFKIAQLEAKQRGFFHIAYGYNASDRKDIRPGQLSAKENHIHAPLDDASLEKDDIREVLKVMNLKLADKVSSPCLASRLMTGVRVTEEKLLHIQKMETILRAAGIKVYRVRLHEEQIRYFRIEIDPSEMEKILPIRELLVKEARNMGYRWVNLDLAGYQMGGGTLKT